MPKNGNLYGLVGDLIDRKIVRPMTTARDQRPFIVVERAPKVRVGSRNSVDVSTIENAIVCEFHPVERCPRV